MIIVGNAGKLFDFIGVRVEVHTQSGADFRYSFARLQFIVNKIADNSIARSICSAGCDRRCIGGGRRRIAGGSRSAARCAYSCTCRPDRNWQIECLADADAVQIIGIVQCFQLSLDLCKIQLINTANDCSSFAALDLMGYNLGIAASLGDCQARNHNNLSRGDVIVVGKAG